MPSGPMRRVRSTPSPKRVISAKSAKTLKPLSCEISAMRRRMVLVPISIAANRLGPAFACLLLCNLDFIAALLLTAVAHGHLLNENRLPALGTASRHRTIPGGEFAIGITIAAVEDLSTARLSLFKVTLFPFRTFDAEIHRFLQRTDRKS